MTTTSMDADQSGEPSEDDYLADTPESLAGPDLFSAIKTGLHDGFLVDDLGWALFSIRETFGIEPKVALTNNQTAQDYFDWVQSKVGVSLVDWEPVQLTLFQAWVGVSAETSPTGLASSYRVWRDSNQCSDALVIQPVDVFAIRHCAWPLLERERVREFYVALQRSGMAARWSRSNPGRDMAPEDMEGDAGFVVIGSPSGQQGRVRLTWPTANLDEVIAEANLLEANGVAGLIISETEGVGYSFNQQNLGTWLRIAQLDRHCGGNACLLDLARRVGM